MAVFSGQGVDHNLPDLPGKIITGNIDWEKSYFLALGLGKTLGTLDTLRGTLFSNLSYGYELVLVQHRGLQSNQELGGAYTLRTSELYLGPLEVNFGAGTGLSYAFGTPNYEDGPMDDDPERRYRLQLLALFELEWHLSSVENFSFVTRIHHRSGAYGLIAPPHVGSNFIAAGLRYQF